MACGRGEKLLAAEGGVELYFSHVAFLLLVDKGLVSLEYLACFYPDLYDPQLESSMCVFHQRFSTNTTPQWHLCHPFRYLAHNGEINTISGNRKWALARAKKFQCEALPDIEEIAQIGRAHV